MVDEGGLAPVYETERHAFGRSIFADIEEGLGTLGVRFWIEEPIVAKNFTQEPDRELSRFLVPRAEKGGGWLGFFGFYGEQRRDFSDSGFLRLNGFYCFREVIQRVNKEKMKGEERGGQENLTQHLTGLQNI